MNFKGRCREITCILGFHLIVFMYIYPPDGSITSSEKLTQMQEAFMDAAGENEPSQDTSFSEIDQLKTGNYSQNSSKDPLVLLCCKDALLLYHKKSVVKVRGFYYYNYTLVMMLWLFKSEIVRVVTLSGEE